jgi:hypothetical protein
VFGEFLPLVDKGVCSRISECTAGTYLKNSVDQNFLVFDVRRLCHHQWQNRIKFEGEEFRFGIGIRNYDINKNLLSILFRKPHYFTIHTNCNLQTCHKPKERELISFSEK